MLKKKKIDLKLLTRFQLMVTILCLIFILSLSSKCLSYVPYFYPQYPIWLTDPWLLNPYYPSGLPVYNPVPPFFAQPYPYVAPLLAVSPPVSMTRSPAAATIIITNPTAGTVAITTIAPPAATVPAPVSPLAASLISTWAADLYFPAPISTANPLLFAVLSNLLI